MSIRKKLQRAKDVLRPSGHAEWDAVLQDAATQGDTERALYALKMGADIDCDVIGNGWRPLHLAASNGHATLVRELIARGAGVNKHAGNGYLPITAAHDNDHPDVVLILAEAGSETTSFDYKGRAPLHYAITNFNRKLLTVLLDNGADPDVPSHDNTRPLHRVIGREDFDMTALLLGAGADPNTYDRDGLQALHHAAKTGNEAIITLTLRHGGELESQAISGNTPRDLAVACNKAASFDSAVSTFHSARLHSTRLHSIRQNSRKTRRGLSSPAKPR